jgi:hypothetical protein
LKGDKHGRDVGAPQGGTASVVVENLKIKENE